MRRCTKWLWLGDTRPVGAVGSKRSVLVPLVVLAIATAGCATSLPKFDLPKRCDSNVSSTSDVSCGVAENTFYEYHKATGGDATQPRTVQAWSPATKRYYTETCSSGEGMVHCTHGNGSEVRFNQRAIHSYSSTDASVYVRSHDLGPKG